MSSVENAEDVYKYEEQQERRALLKSMHQPMKSWFNSLPQTFTQKFGTFPLFWQDLEQWGHVKVVQKLYLAATESEDPSGVDIFKLEEKLFARASEGGTGLGGQQENLESNSLEQAKAEPTKKRRSRWGDSAETKNEQKMESSTNSTAPLTTDNDNDQSSKVEPVQKKRRSRFSVASSESSTVDTAPGATGAVTGLAAAAALAAKLGIGSAASIPTPTSTNPLLLDKPLTMPVITEEIMQQTMILQMQLKNIGDRLMTVVADAAALENDPNRPPSPPPKYDSKGIRTNTREVRMREELSKQRTEVIEELLRINPMYQPPPDYVRARPFKKIYIPYKENPTYNFIGIIIGPRGNTQKRMEQETGAKISIRGKGSVKDGAKGRSKQDGPDEDDELHVHVDGPTMETVERACKLIEELLVVVDDDKNEHKQKQLRELALINGTLKEDEYCSVCAEKGHRHFECPQRTKSFKAAGVKCAICGDQSHPTRDCPLKNDAPTNDVVLDTEYESFMAELGDGKGKNDTNIDDSIAGVGKGDGGASGGERVTSGSKISEDDQVKISMTSSGTGVQQTVIEVKTLLTGMNVPATSSQQQVQQMIPGQAAGYVFDPVQQQWVQQHAQYGAYPQQMGYPQQYGAYGYPMYQQTQPGPGVYPQSYDPYAYTATASTVNEQPTVDGVPYDDSNNPVYVPPPSTTNFPPPPPGDHDMDMS